MENILFKAKFPKITLAKETKIELILPEGTSFEKIAEIARFKGGDIFVQFGDPQMSMSFTPASGGRLGVVAVVNNRGEVESTHCDDDDHGDLFEQESSEESDSEGEQESEEKIKGEEVAEDSEGSDEVEFEDGDDPTDPDPVEEEEDYEDVPEPEEIEAYILSEQQVFDSIPYNFPELIRQRREEDATWMNLARDAGIPSTQLQAAFRSYKKLVVAQMREQGVA